MLTTGFGGPHGIINDLAALSDGYVLTQRMLGWLDALTAANIRPTVARQPHESDQASYDGARLLLASEPRPTGQLCFSDRMAQEAVQAAQDLGLDIPSDLSDVGFDDNPLARCMRPALTTDRQDVTAKGRAAAALTQAIERARQGATSRQEHLHLPQSSSFEHR
ncbi:MAG TPA: substrate-binding domain-containing protein [Jiangellaceae bacterium]